MPVALLGSTLKYIAGISHPFIAGGERQIRALRVFNVPPCLGSYGSLHESERPAAVMIRSYTPRGSLRDVIQRNRNPKLNFYRKYLVSKNKGLEPRLARLFSRQIIEVGEGAGEGAGSIQSLNDTVFSPKTRR